jgi:hypothetical protein
VPLPEIWIYSRKRQPALHHTACCLAWPMPAPSTSPSCPSRELRGSQQRGCISSTQRQGTPGSAQYHSPPISSHGLGQDGTGTVQTLWMRLRPTEQSTKFSPHMHGQPLEGGGPRKHIKHQLLLDPCPLHLGTLG